MIFLLLASPSAFCLMHSLHRYIVFKILSYTFFLSFLLAGSTLAVIPASLQPLVQLSALSRRAPISPAGLTLGVIPPSQRLIHLKQFCDTLAFAHLGAETICSHNSPVVLLVCPAPNFGAKVQFFFHIDKLSGRKMQIWLHFAQRLKVKS